MASYLFLSWRSGQMKRYLAIDIGGTAIKYGIIDEDARILSREETATNSFQGGEKILLKVLDIVEEKIHEEEITGVAISTAGMVNPDSGEIFYASDLIPGYEGINYKKEIKEKFDLPCEVENDVNCAGLAESISGAAKGTGSSVMLTVGTGIGGCLIINDRIYHGFSNAACEVGYMRIDGDNYERKGAASVLVKNVAAEKNESPDSWNGRKVFEKALAGDEVCKRNIDIMCHEIAKGIANICYVVNPEMVVLGGGIMAQGEKIRGILERYLDIYLVPGIRKHTKLQFAENGNDAGMLGAFYNFRQKHGSDN